MKDSPSGLLPTAEGMPVVGLGGAVVRAQRLKQVHQSPSTQSVCSSRSRSTVPKSQPPLPLPALPPPPAELERKLPQHASRPSYQSDKILVLAYLIDFHWHVV